MYFETLNTELRLQGLLGIRTYYCSLMEGRAMKPPLAGRRNLAPRRPKPQLTKKKSFPLGYFSVKSFMLLACLTASLLILPLVLPPLPPPPIILLLLPIGILLVLLVLAFHAF